MPTIQLGLGDELTIVFEDSDAQMYHNEKETGTVQDIRTVTPQKVQFELSCDSQNDFLVTLWEDESYSGVELMDNGILKSIPCEFSINGADGQLDLF